MIYDYKWKMKRIGYQIIARNLKSGVIVSNQTYTSSAYGGKLELDLLRDAAKAFALQLVMHCLTEDTIVRVYRVTEVYKDVQWYYLRRNNVIYRSRRRNSDDPYLMWQEILKSI